MYSQKIFLTREKHCADIEIKIAVAIIPLPNLLSVEIYFGFAHCAFKKQNGFFAGGKCRQCKVVAVAAFAGIRQRPGTACFFSSNFFSILFNGYHLPVNFFIKRAVNSPVMWYRYCLPSLVIKVDFKSIIVFPFSKFPPIAEDCYHTGLCKCRKYIN